MTHRSLLLGFAWILAAQCASPCGCVSPTGRAVIFGDQTNIIVWDTATGTEHFIRNAKFTSEAKSFGFIAPTPTKPDLAQASSQAFELLASLKPPPPPVSGPVPGAKAVEPKEVKVIQQVDVAGYRATTLLASDASALASWMKKNGYATTPDIEQWTRFYIAKGWYLTAFKVINPAQVAATGTIRMSFKTKQPFNPYYVPKDNISASRPGVLKLYFVSGGEYEGRIGGTQPWSDAEWHADVPPDTTAVLAKELKLSPASFPLNAQVDAFSDYNFPNEAADDIYFSPKKNFPINGLAAVCAVWAAAAILWSRKIKRRNQR
jgi:hypothetical protein